MEPCRKCGTPNPPSNQYCKSCGAVLNVATSLVKAQARTLFPIVASFRWRWVLLGVPVLLGTTSIFAVGIAALLSSLLGSFSNGSLSSMSEKAPGLAVVAALLFVLAFTLGGFMIARVAKKRTVAEPAVASLVVLAVLAISGQALSTDALLVGAVFALPCTLMGALGGWFGGLGGRRGR